MTTLVPSGARTRRASQVVVTGLAGILMLFMAVNSRTSSELQPNENIVEDRAIANGEDVDVLSPDIALPETAWVNGQDVRETNAMLTVAAAATAQYQDVYRAQADGYRPVTGVLTGSAKHFVSQRALEDEGFTVGRPEVLLYDDVADGSLALVGVAYVLRQRSANEAPPREFGPFAHWHAHHYRWPCLTVRTDGPPITVDRSDAACRAAGDVVFPTRFWMLHVWLFRPSPDGVFNEVNSTIEAPEVLVEGMVK